MKRIKLSRKEYKTLYELLELQLKIEGNYLQQLIDLNRNYKKQEKYVKDLKQLFEKILK